MKIPANYCTLFVVLILAIASTSLPSCKAAARAGHKSSVSTAQTDRLKQKTCLLVLPASQYDYIEDYRALLSKAWTLTPIDVIRHDLLSMYTSQTDQYAFFMIDGVESKYTSPNTGMVTTSTHYYLSLMLAEPGKKKMKTESLSKVELYPEFATTSYGFGHKDLADQIYERSSFRNFQVPYIVAYLRFMQRNLENQKNPWIYDNYTDKNLLGKLAKDTLYILNNELFSRNKFTGKEAEMSESIFSSYPGKHKFVSPEQLTALIKTRKENQPLFLFEYVLGSSDKFVGVLDISSGSVVYRRYTAMSYNLKAKDIDRILD